MVVEWHVLLLALLCCSVAQQSVETKQVDNRSAKVYHAVPGGDHAVRRFIGRRHVRAAEIVCKDCQACTDCNLSTSGYAVAGSGSIPTSPPATNGQYKRWWGTSPSDHCTPYKLNGRKDMDEMCQDMQSWSDAHLQKLWDAAAVPSKTEGFPLRGCSYRCLAGQGTIALLARLPTVNSGWSGKCFGFSLNETTGVPLGLANSFAPGYDDTKLPPNKRVAGVMQGLASVYWDTASLVDGKPCWVFDYSKAEDIYYASMDARMVISGVRDEVRQVADGYLLGRMHLLEGNKVHKVPFYFVLFQACTADYTFPTNPSTRALPPLHVEQSRSRVAPSTLA